MYSMTSFKLTIVLLMLMSSPASNAKNVALYRSGTFCSSDASEELFDGEKNFTQPTVLNGTFTCESNGILEIDLGGMFNIHYVIIYEGKGGAEDQFDFFDVFLKDGEGLLVCSKFAAPKVRPVHKRQLRVNCIPTPIQSPKIVIDILKSNVIHVSEIEAHTLGSDGTDNKVLINRGCFRQFGGVPTTIVGSLLRGCQEECSSVGYIFAAIQANSSCRCDGDYDESQEIPPEFCDMRCSGSKKFCGGKGAFSVYMVIPSLPRYRGCYGLNGDAGKEIANITVLKCIKICDNFIYASIKGSNCFCSDTISHLTMGDGCKNKCNGDRWSICGGRHHFSVYETCLKVYIQSMRCQDLLKCSGNYDMFGQCDGACKPGFIGDHCLERSQYFELTTVATVNVTVKVTSVFRFLHLWTGLFILILTCYCVCCFSPPASIRRSAMGSIGNEAEVSIAALKMGRM